MKFGASLISIAAAIGLSSAAAIDRVQHNAIEARDTLCAPPHLAEYNLVGGGGGSMFCETEWPGPSIVKRLTTYSNKNDITGFEIEYTSGKISQQGKGFNTKSSGEIVFAQGETVKSAWLAGNGVGKTLGKIHLETTKQTVDLGTSDAPNVYRTDVGSGLFVGMTGYAGDEIYNSALMFVKPQIKTWSMSNVNIDPAQLALPSNNQFQSNSYGNTVYVNNDPHNDGGFAFAASSVLTISHSFSSSTTNTFGLSVSFGVEVGIPLIADSKIDTEWSYSHTSGTVNEVATSSAVTLAATQTGKVPANSAMQCAGLVSTGKANFAYSSSITIQFDDGSNFVYSENGNLQDVAVSKMNISCNPIPLGQSPGSGYTTSTLAAVSSSTVASSSSSSAASSSGSSSGTSSSSSQSSTTGSSSSSGSSSSASTASSTTGSSSSTQSSSSAPITSSASTSTVSSSSSQSTSSRSSSSSGSSSSSSSGSSSPASSTGSSSSQSKTVEPQSYASSASSTSSTQASTTESSSTSSHKSKTHHSKSTESKSSSSTKEHVTTSASSTGHESASTTSAASTSGSSSSSSSKSSSVSSGVTSSATSSSTHIKSSSTTEPAGYSTSSEHKSSSSTAKESSSTPAPGKYITSSTSEHKSSSTQASSSSSSSSVAKVTSSSTSTSHSSTVTPTSSSTSHSSSAVTTSSSTSHTSSSSVHSSSTSSDCEKSSTMKTMTSTSAPAPAATSHGAIQTGPGPILP